MKAELLKRRAPALALMTGALSFTALLSSPDVYASSSFLSTWNNLYPGSNSGNSGDCQLCHGNSTQTLNPYGAALCNSNAGSITNRIHAVESANSDTDPTGASNLSEANASTQPGWTPGIVNPTYSRSTCAATGNVEAPPSFIGTSLDPAAGNQPPVASVNGPYNGTVGIALPFSSAGSNDPDGSIVAYDWNFGDGSSAGSANPNHTYASAGTFTVSLTVTDDGGDSTTDTTSATIGLGNQPPVAQANGPYTAMTGDAVNFSSAGSSDPDGSIAAYDWDFGDGSVGSGASATHSYGAPGTYNVTLTVTDNNGATDAAATSATISAQPVNQLPVANAGGPYSGMTGAAVSFDASASSDPDGSIVQYAWDFGDGNTGNGVNTSHGYSVDGNYTVTLTVTDDAGGTASASTTASIGAVNLPPVANAGGPYSGTAGTVVAFDGSASSDPDGSISAYAWDFGDGTTGNGVNATHSYGVNGNYTVTLTVTDDAGDSASAGTTASIGSGNLPPVAAAGGPYSGTAGTPVAFDGSASSDPDGSILQYDWDFGDGSHGSGMAQQHSYNVPGTYNVTLQVTDNNGATDAALTTVTVSAQPGSGTADVRLDRLQTPRSQSGRTGRTLAQSVVAIATGDGATQDATVMLAVSSPSGVTVTIQPDSITHSVMPGERTGYRFRADIRCDAPGSYTLDWTASISAAENSDTGNDTQSAATQVSCGKPTRGDGQSQGGHGGSDDSETDAQTRPWRWSR